VPDIDPPNIGEIVRRLDHIASQQAEMLREFKADRVDAAKTYVRQDVYMIAEQLTNSLIADTRSDIATVDAKVEAHHEAYKKDRAADASARRTTLFWLGSLTVTVLFGIASLIIALLTFLR
jgi:hypothetical protein